MSHKSPKEMLFNIAFAKALRNIYKVGLFTRLDNLQNLSEWLSYSASINSMKKQIKAVFALCTIQAHYVSVYQGHIYSHFFSWVCFNGIGVVFSGSCGAVCFVVQPMGCPCFRCCGSRGMGQAAFLSSLLTAAAVLADGVEGWLSF